ncbi:MAG: hypothetical protein HZC28_15725 [Spirochaetes bacterium]|nr:hypothetical protein [Spirochaetota bacterium]
MRFLRNIGTAAAALLLAGVLSAQTSSFQFAGTSLDDVAKILSQKMEKNIIVEDGVDKKITARLEKINAREALDIICKTHNLRYLEETNVIIIMDNERFLIKGVRSMTVRRIPVKHTPCRRVFAKLALPEKQTELPGIEQMKSGFGTSPTGGKIYFDESDNSIIAVDTDENIKTIAALIEQFDVRIRQVLIEAKIVRITLSSNQKYGIDWRQLFSSHAQAPLSRAGTTNEIVSINIPAMSWPIKFYDFSTTLSIEAVVEMIAKDNDVDTLANPRILCQNGEEAKIHVGRSVPYDVVTVTDKGDKVQDTRFIDVGIKLNVKPRIFQDDVSLKVTPEVSSAEQAAVGSAPTVTTSTADATVIVRNGENVIVGGLIERTKENLETKFPILGDIPIVGWLFKSASYTDERREIVVFLSVKIID